jgi:tetratricopeptide (TPR) repeat protein
MHLGDTSGPAGAAIDMYVGMHCGTLGRYREALASLDAALACFARDGQTVWTAVASNHKAAYLIELGQLARARKTLEYTTPTIDSVRARRELLVARIERRLGKGGEVQIRDALAMLGERGDVYMTMIVRLEAATSESAATALASCASVRDRAEQLEYLGIAVKARLWFARHLLRAGDARSALAALREVLPMLDEVQPADMFLPEAWLIAYEVFDSAGEPAAAIEALKRAVEWIEQSALPHVPDEYCDSFLNRNPVNRTILTTASRRQ